MAEIAESESLTKEEQEKYCNLMMKRLKQYAAHKVLNDNWLEGWTKGWVKGFKEGIEEEKLETAKRLIAMGLSLEQIAKGTGLPLDSVSKLTK